MTDVTHTANRITPEEPVDSALARCAQRLRDLAERTLSFQQQQMDRLQATWDMCLSQTTDGVPPADAVVAWQAAQQAWERQKALDEARIDEQLDHLAHAWLEVEREQRRLLTLGAAAASPVRLATDAAAPCEDAGTLDLIDSPNRSAAGSAAVQFQKLKREIQQQARRVR